MPGYLLIWNPALQDWPEAAEQVQRVRAEEIVTTTWGSGSRKDLPTGSRLFLMRTGKRPHGLIGTGWSTGPIFSAEHWSGNGKSTLYVPLRIDSLVSPDADEELLPVEELQAEFPNGGVYWDTPASGIEIGDEDLEVLERRWVEHLVRAEYWPRTTSHTQERPLRLVRRKERDSDFSRQVRAWSGGRCAVCPPAMQYEAVGILETAHIRAVEVDGPDEFENALALCPNHHALFDEGFWTVEQGRLVFSAALPEALRATFAETLNCGWTLAPEHLEWHRRERFHP